MVQLLRWLYECKLYSMCLVHDGTYLTQHPFGVLFHDTGLAWAIDGNWKLTFPVCTFPVRATQPGMRGLNAPDVCPEQPCGNAAFCTEHLVLAQQRGYPSTIKEFLRYCGALKTAGKPDMRLSQRNIYSTWNCTSIRLWYA